MATNDQVIDDINSRLDRLERTRGYSAAYEPTNNARFAAARPLAASGNISEFPQYHKSPGERSAQRALDHVAKLEQQRHAVRPANPTPGSSVGKRPKVLVSGFWDLIHSGHVG